MAMMWKRMSDHNPKQWRHVYKVPAGLRMSCRTRPSSTPTPTSLARAQSLQLLDFLIRNGADHVVTEARANIFQVQSLTDFQLMKENQDVGVNSAFIW